MDTNNELILDVVLDMIADKLAKRLSQNSAQLQQRLMTIEQAAAYLGRTPEATQHLTSSGKIPTVRADRRVFVDRLDLDQWITDNKTGWA